MPLQPPNSVKAVLEEFNARSDIFTTRDVETAIQASVKDRESVPSENRRGWWAEWAAFAFQTREAPKGGPWGTHFQPWMSGTSNDGSLFYVPDLREADVETVDYWAARAKIAKHPVLVARYADLAWDTRAFVTKSPRGRDSIDFARLAIDKYILASRLDNGYAWSDTRDNLGRALELALNVKDCARTNAAVEANIEYVDRTSDDEKIGTYCYLFDRLLPADKGPQLKEDQEKELVDRFEAKFAAMIAPGSKWYADPHGPQSVGRLLAAYYQRKGRGGDRTRILRDVAETFERRAKAGDALAGIMFLDVARRMYQDAGLREEAERVQREAQALGPDAIKCMAPITVETEIKKEELEQYLEGMMTGGLEEATERFAIHFVPRQREILDWIAQRDSQFVSHKIFPTTKIAHGHIVAHVGDDTADPDGKMVHETADRMQYSVPWIGWTLDRMIREGFSTKHAMDFIRATPIFDEGRLRLVERGIEAHLRGDYVQAVHILLPQIENAIRTLIYVVGKPSNKTHRTGRGVMQFKNLNDLLSKDDWPVPGERGENLRMYILAALAHPKGANIRNDVAHGLWPEFAFQRGISDRVFHVLLAVATIRLKRQSQAEDAAITESDAGES